jgi:Domain of unknown function (DUF4936)
MRELYVYWKAPRASAAAVPAEVGQALRDLMRQHPGLQARLLRRAESSGDTLTWMETYTAPGGITPILQAQIEATLAPLLLRLQAGPRHTEVFEAAG